MKVITWTTTVAAMAAALTCEIAEARIGRKMACPVAPNVQCFAICPERPVRMFNLGPLHNCGKNAYPVSDGCCGYNCRSRKCDLPNNRDEDEDLGRPSLIKRYFEKSNRGWDQDNEDLGRPSLIKRYLEKSNRGW